MNMGHDLPSCPDKGKISYSTRAKARKGLRHPRSANRSAGAVYKCRHCPYWHLTTKK